ncbi:MAG: thioredoxin family protein [Bacteroidetes bacterium]|nr:MAG: thioredoxin family protein [Bacteroidota bacterium]
MKKLLFALFLLAATVVSAQTPAGYKVGDLAQPFNLKNVDGKTVSPASFPNAKGFILVFTCNECPYTQAYEQRIIELDKEFRPKGYPVIAINPNDPRAVPGDSFEEMVKRAKDKKYTFPYLVDETQEVARTYGANRTPHVFVLEKSADSQLFVRYIGAIDNSSESAKGASQLYVSDAVNQLLAGKPVSQTLTRAIGCGIKWKTM